MLIKTNLSNDVVAVAMSGGVDSTIAAALMQKEGYETIGLTMRLFADSNLEKAKYSAKQLGISHHIIDFEEIFREKIIQNFINEYLMGHTPNPCVLCNKFIKFGALLDYAHSLGAKFLITGHYAQIIYNKERYCLAKGLDKTKEQSYFLWSLRQEQLANIKFPLGKYHKSEIKQLAKELKLTSAEAKESQEICFIPDDDYKKFLLKYFSDFSDFSSSSSSLETIRSGLIMNSNGEILGEHKGIPFYTIGQRRGLGISYSKPLYVYKMDVENNIIYVGPGKEFYSTNRNFWISTKYYPNASQNF